MERTLVPEFGEDNAESAACRNSVLLYTEPCTGAATVCPAAENVTVCPSNLLLRATKFLRLFFCFCSLPRQFAPQGRSDPSAPHGDRITISSSHIFNVFRRILMCGGPVWSYTDRFEPESRIDGRSSLHRGLRCKIALKNERTIFLIQWRLLFGGSSWKAFGYMDLQ
jgi:hypothetical protein